MLSKMLHLCKLSNRSKFSGKAIKRGSGEITSYRNYSKIANWHDWNRLQSAISLESWKKCYTGKLKAFINFVEPAPSIQDFRLLTFGFLLLIEKYAFHIKTLIEPKKGTHGKV